MQFLYMMPDELLKKLPEFGKLNKVLVTIAFAACQSIEKRNENDENQN